MKLRFFQNGSSCPSWQWILLQGIFLCSIFCIKIHMKSSTSKHQLTAVPHQSCPAALTCFINCEWTCSPWHKVCREKLQLLFLKLHVHVRAGVLCQTMVLFCLRNLFLFVWLVVVCLFACWFCLFVSRKLFSRKLSDLTAGRQQF